MGVARYFEPTFTLTFSEQGLDLTMATNVHVTFTSGDFVLDKDGESLTVGEKTIAVSLTQEETMRFKVGSVCVQANWKMDGKRCGSEIVRFAVTKNLLEKVI